MPKGKGLRHSRLSSSDIEEHAERLRIEREKRLLIDAIEAMRHSGLPSSSGQPSSSSFPGTLPSSSIEGKGEREARKETSSLSSPAIPGEVSCSDGKGGSSLEQELLRLQEELRRAQATNTALEEEMKRMEQQALIAIAEASRLRRLLSQEKRDPEATKEVSPSNLPSSAGGSDEGVRMQLTEALIQSELEITRLTKNIDLLLRRLVID